MFNAEFSPVVAEIYPGEIRNRVVRLHPHIVAEEKICKRPEAVSHARIFGSYFDFIAQLQYRPMLTKEQKPIAFIRELCKEKTEQEILEAEENFRRYLTLVKRICERLGHEENHERDD